MSSPKADRDSDRESLTDWTLVDREGTPDKTKHTSAGKDDKKEKDAAESKPSPADVEKKKDSSKEQNESGRGTEEEEGEEELSEDLISMGKRVQEIKASGSDSSDIETLECPGPEEFYDDHTQGYSSLHSSLLSSSLSGFTFVEDADDGDVESLGSSDVLVLEQEGKGADEETDLSLASSPSLPDDLPAIKPDTQYRHTPDRDLNSRLNIVVALTLACVVGLGLGHFLGWSSRSIWEENLNSAQVRRLRELQDDLLSCINTPPSPPPPNEETKSREPEYLPTTSFIPVLTEAEGEGAANVETFVESLVVPLEEAGVVIDAGQQQQQHKVIHHTHHKTKNSWEPTFATLDLLYGSSDPAPALDQDQEPRIHSGLFEPPLTSHTLAEDEIDPSQPQLPLSMKTVEPTFNEELSSHPTVSQTNTLPPVVELDSGFESFVSEESEPFLQNSAVIEEDDTSSIAIENSQVIDALNLENEDLRSEIYRLQQENVSPIKISGKDGKIARELRERITQLLIDNEELRVAVAKEQFAALPDGDTKAFNSVLGTNYKLKLAVNKLYHLVPDITSLQVSANDLQKENEELQMQVGKLRYQEQPLPQELNGVTREVQNLKRVIDEASKKKKVPSNYDNAKVYFSYMSQVLQALHDFKDGGFVEKLDVATDVFEGLVPGNVKPTPAVYQKLNTVRGKFSELKSALASRWEKVKDLGRPQNLASVSQDTMSKMNRVIVNVVNKMKDIGQISIMKRGKASLESTVASLSQSLAALGDQFDKTWTNLEVEVSMEGEVDGNLLENEDVGIEEEEEEEDEAAVDEGDGEDKGREPQDKGNEISEKGDFGLNKARKDGRRNDGTGNGGKGGGRGGGGDGGRDGKKELDEKKDDKEDGEKNDGKRDKSRSRMSDKDKKKEEKKEKKAKKKEEKEKKKKEKEDKKSSKKDKESKEKKREEKKEYGGKKEDWSKKSIQEDDSRHHRKQFNKYDKKQQRYSTDDEDDDDDDDDDDEEEESDTGKFKRKYHKKKQTHNDDVDDNDDKLKRKFHKKDVQENDDDDDEDEEDKKKGLLRHWEKPSRKNYRREYPGPKKAFIRRRGKNATRYHGDEGRDWMEKRATSRELRRREEQRADWIFERAKHRSNKREEEHKADWQFDRATHRKDQRVGEVDDHRHGDFERLGHSKHERRQAKRRYVRFDNDNDYDDDDDDEFTDDEYEPYHHHHNHHYHHHHHHHQERGREHKHHNKGKREWVIPNFTATGKTYYY